MSEVASIISESSVAGQSDSKKRQPVNNTTTENSSANTNVPRSSRRLAKQDSAPSLPDPPKVFQKGEKKLEKKKPVRPKTMVDPNRETVITENGFQLHPNDHIYLVSEPPGEPYYIARIMEFIYLDSNSSDPYKHDLPISSTTRRPVKSIRVNWFYRQQDISHKTQMDTRSLYATMHSDVCPIGAVRGLCNVRHRSEILNREFEEYKKGEDNFYFSRLHDRYIQRNYDIVPVAEVTNVPDRVGEVLREKWKYVVVENGAKKELCMEPRRCAKCGEWCRSSESVRCTECHTDWHMKCVKPPLPRKPTKGYHWACGPCIRARLKEMKANNIPMFDLKKHQNGEENGEEEDDEEQHDEEEEESALSESGIPESAGVNTRADTPITDLNDGEYHSGTNEGKFASRLWPYRYLGIHCKVEDILDFSDRIYPRAASRIGARHQANVQEWPGRPIEYIENRSLLANLAKLDKKSKKYKTALAAMKEGTETPDEGSMINTPIEDEDRPPWVQEKPLGYIARGEDTFSSDGAGTQLVWKKPTEVSSEEIDAYIRDLAPEAERLKVPPFSTSFLEGAINALQYSSFDFQKAKDLVHSLTPESLWNPIFTPDEIKRFESGVAKFGSELHLVAKEVGTRATAECVRFYYMWKKTPSGREIWGKQEGRKGNRQKAAAAEDVPDVGDSSDDSAFDDRKAVRQRKKFECKFCQVQTSRRWRKPPGGIVFSGEDDGVILALCDRCGDLWRRYGIQYVVPEELKKPVETKAPKRRKTEDEEEEVSTKKKKVKKDSGKEKDDKTVRRTRTGSIEKPSYPPCAVCGFVEDEEPYTCSVCGLTVHAGCYGIIQKNKKGSWACDPCINEKQPLASTKYDCVLCAQRETAEKTTKGDLPPRHPLKMTANNNWAHVACAVFIPETRFGSSKRLKPVEGIGSILPSRWNQICSLCNLHHGATINCHDCKRPVHVSCAMTAGFLAGFDIQPVKGSRRDVVQVINFGGEAGVMSAAVWCPEHDLKKTFVHPLTEVDPITGETALMTYAAAYKQADLTLTGTMRKAQLVATATKTSRKVTTTAHAESPTPNLHDPKRRASSISTLSHILPFNDERPKQCNQCQVRFSPKWWLQKPEGDEEVLLCHKCHWQETHSEDVEMNGIEKAPSEKALSEQEATGMVVPDGSVSQDMHIGIAV